MALCAYFARYEFEAIKAQQREDKSALQTVHDRIAQLDTKIAVLLARSDNQHERPARERR